MSRRLAVGGGLRDDNLIGQFANCHGSGPFDAAVLPITSDNQNRTAFQFHPTATIGAPQRGNKTARHLIDRVSLLYTVYR